MVDRGCSVESSDLLYRTDLQVDAPKNNPQTLLQIA